MYKEILKDKLCYLSNKCHQQSVITVKSNHIQIINKELNVDICYYVSKGNKKLPKDHYIFNISSATNCISNKLNLCPYGANGSCYAFKAEKQYKDCLPCRNNQEKAWNIIKDNNLIYEFIFGLVLMSYQSNKHQLKAFRLNESGDIKDILDLIFFEIISKELKTVGITTYTYTHRRDLISSIKARTNTLIINGSDFMLDNEFKVVSKYSGSNPVCVSNCSKCNLCKIKGFKTIEILKH